MALRSQSSQARAVGAFNPTAPQLGFLQPLLVGLGGDNRTYVQALDSPERIASFVDVTWPDRDFLQFSSEFILTVNGPALWAFQFPGEPPLVDYWQEFRNLLGARVYDPELMNHPLLQFDIVDTLDLHEEKQQVFTRAYQVYTAMGLEAANRWRDRTILEPAIARRFAQIDIRPELAGGMRQGRKQAGEDFPKLRARAANGRIEVRTIRLDSGQKRAIQQAYDELAVQLPDLFSTNVDVVFHDATSRPSSPEARTNRIKVVTLGRLDQNLSQRDQWLDRGIEIFNEAEFSKQAYSELPSSQITVLVGAQADWRVLVAAGKRVADQIGLIVMLSTSASLLVRDLEIQSATDLRTISFFAPYLTSTFGARDPIQAIEPVLKILVDENRRVGQQALQQVFPLQHNVLMREPILNGQTQLEIACRLGARALRAGVVIDSHARMYVLGNTPLLYEDISDALAKIFSVDDCNRLEVMTRRPAIMLFAERSSRFEPRMRSMRQRQGVLRLLKIMGWTIFNETERGAQIGGLDRQFDVAVVDDTGVIPAEDPGVTVPGFNRSPLLIVHYSPRRDLLLTANCGSYFHVAVEDIALMAPDRPWVWTIIKRQLFEGSSRRTQAALRLATALVMEAIQQQRIIDPSSADIDWKEVHDLLRHAKSERFVRFSNERAVRGRISLVVQSDALHSETIVDLYIQVNGPVIQGVIERQLPF